MAGYGEIFTVEEAHAEATGNSHSNVDTEAKSCRAEPHKQQTAYDNRLSAFVVGNGSPDIAEKRRGRGRGGGEGERAAGGREGGRELHVWCKSYQFIIIISYYCTCCSLVVHTIVSYP